MTKITNEIALFRAAHLISFMSIHLFPVWVLFFPSQRDVAPVPSLPTGAVFTGRDDSDPLMSGRTRSSTVRHHVR